MPKVGPNKRKSHHILLPRSYANPAPYSRQTRNLILKLPTCHTLTSMIVSFPVVGRGRIEGWIVLSKKSFVARIANRYICYRVVSANGRDNLNQSFVKGNRGRRVCKAGYRKSESRCKKVCSRVSSMCHFREIIYVKSCVDSRV